MKKSMKNINKNKYALNSLIDVHNNISTFQHLLWSVFIVFASIVASSFLNSIDISYFTIPKILADNVVIKFLMLISTIIISLNFFYLRIHSYRLSTTQYYILFSILLVYLNLRFIHGTPIHWEFIYWKDNLAVLDIPFSLLCFLFINSFRKEFIKRKTPPKSIFLEDIPQGNIANSNQYENLLSNIESVLFKDCFERAFTIGIIGSWGSGKSSLINSITNKIEQHPDFNKTIILIPFSPFLNHSDEKIVQEFFHQLSNELNKKSGKLSKKLLVYAAKLSNAIKDGNPLSFLKTNVSSNENESVKELYDDIIEVLESLNLKIVVTIDDLDRLSSKEILQVLKLIRNTANFPNTVFFVALDKEYVSNALRSDKDYMTEKYLDKFFQLELHVSKTPMNVVIDFALNKILTGLTEIGLDSVNRNKLNNIFKQNTIWFNHFLIHYRDAKRFVNQFILDFKLLHARDINSEEIKYLDFTALTLIKLFGTNEFRMIENRNEKLIYKSKTIFGLWMLNENRGSSCSPKIDQILIELFPSHHKDNTFSTVQINRNSIAFDKSLRLYFERILSIEELTEAEFKEIYFSDDLESIKLRILDLSRSSQKVNHFIEMLIAEDEHEARLPFKTIILMYAINQLDGINDHFFSEFNRLLNLVRNSNAENYSKIKEIALSSKDYSPVFRAKFLHVISNYELVLQDDDNNLLQVYSDQLLMRYSNSESELPFQFFFKEFKAAFNELFKIRKIRVHLQEFVKKNILIANENIFLQQTIILGSNHVQWRLDPLIFQIIGDYPEIGAFAKSAFDSNSDELLEYLNFLELYRIQNGENPITYDFKHLKLLDIFGQPLIIQHHGGYGQIVFECANGFKDSVKDSFAITQIANKYKPKYYSYSNKDFWFVSFTENDKNGLVSIAKEFQSLADNIKNAHLEYSIVGEGPIVQDKKTKEVIMSIRSIQPLIDLKLVPSALTKL